MLYPEYSRRQYGDLTTNFNTQYRFGVLGGKAYHISTAYKLFLFFTASNLSWMTYNEHYVHQHRLASEAMESYLFPFDRLVPTWIFLVPKLHSSSPLAYSTDI